MFKKTLNCKELWIGEKRGVMVAGIPVLLINTGHGIVAYNDHCPHAGALLSEGTLQDNVLTCARHEWQFNADTGKGINPVNTQLCEYAVFIDEAQDIWVNVGKRMKFMQHYNDVGPVLVAGELATHVIKAIKKINQHVQVQNQGSYLRVLVPFQCKLTKSAVEQQTGTPFIFPDDLELIMPSFKGLLTVSSDEVLWSLEKTNEDQL